ncbi:long-chain fatty acid--CoA ligase [Henriciella barbarensis]|uniref:Long-chain fatty acid--CoA ligase n=1 Tax=Henriciella barbarensis TaxID=86342 RepID=A0A399R477_9PROT|nr:MULTISPECIES: AMP-binding protein [Henriciella]RIJ24657.1 long-chain fatty acid--CoA ligase [Henriciella barbarensis]
MYQVDLKESFFPAQGLPLPDPQTIGEMLRASCAAAPDRPALKELGSGGEIERVWTYAELIADCERLANAIAARHAQGARVAIYANNIPEWILLELACGLAGATLVTVNPAYQKRELEYVLQQSRAEAIYYVDEFRGNPMKEIADSVCDQIPAIKHRILLTDHAALYADDTKPHKRQTKPEDPAQIQYTSGTTGFPKGALLHHNGLVRNGIDAMTRGGMKPGDSFVHHLPLFHTTGCAILVLGGLGVGSTILLAKQFDPPMIAKVMERERTDFVLGVPTMLVALIDEIKRSGRDVSSTSRIMAGGSMVSPDLCRKAHDVFGAPIQIVYGQTESSPVITQAWYDDTIEDLTQTIGQPVPYTEVSVRSPSDNTVLPIGEQGEICCRGYQVMLGYNENPEATAAAIDEEGWLHTGDLGRMDKRGYLRITGRVKEMIIRGGENLFPAEIENALLEHEAIDEIAIVGVADEKWGEQVACFMRSHGDDRPDGAALKAFVRERLSPQKTPAFWVWVEDWPLTGSGKIQRFKLKEAFERGEFQDHLS